MSRQSAKKGTVPLPFRGKWPENRSHNLEKALGEGFDHKFSYGRIDVKTERRKDGVFCEFRRTYVLNNVQDVEEISGITTLISYTFLFIIYPI